MGRSAPVLGGVSLTEQSAVQSWTTDTRDSWRPVIINTEVQTWRLCSEPRLEPAGCFDMCSHFFHTTLPFITKVAAILGHWRDNVRCRSITVTESRPWWFIGCVLIWKEITPKWQSHIVCYYWGNITWSLVHFSQVFILIQVAGKKERKKWVYKITN